MRIKTKKELEFYIKADRIMNGFPIKKSFSEIILGIILPKYFIIRYLKYMRKYSYYKFKNNNLFCRLASIWYGFKFRRLSVKLGFSIGRDCFGYGLVIPHYGTIVVNSKSRIGNYCVLHTCTCIGGGEEKFIGNGFYLSSGAKVMGCLKIGDGVSVASGSLVNKSAESNLLLGGIPAKVLKDNYSYWWERDAFQEKVKKVELIREKMAL